MEKEKIKNKVIKGKKMTTDFVYSIISSIFLTGIMQIIVYPYFAAKCSNEIYGQMLTIMGIANIFTVAIGGGLNNVHLIQMNHYDTTEAYGDFNWLLFWSTSIGTVCWVIMLIFIFHVERISIIFLAGYVCIGIFENYLAVAYRLVINYKANLFYNVYLGVGHLLGIFLARLFDYWPIAFFCGGMAGLSYLLKTTNLYKIRAKRTKLFKKTCQIYLVLLGTTAIANVVNYLDRFFLYPMLGGEQVTVFTVSSFVGKSIGLLVSPIAGVLLSYYAQKTFSMTVKKYWLINLCVMTAGMICVIGTIMFGPWITRLIYPTVADATKQYLFIANMSSLVSALTSILMPSILKFANVFWQIVIQLIYALMYITCGYFALGENGLMGFCISTLLVNALKALILIGIGHFSIARMERKNVK